MQRTSALAALGAHCGRQQRQGAAEGVGTVDLMYSEHTQAIFLEAQDEVSHITSGQRTTDNGQRTEGRETTDDGLGSRESGGETTPCGVSTVSGWT